MHQPKNFASGNIARFVLAIGAVLMGGCGTGLTPGGVVVPPASLNLSVVGLDSASTFFEDGPNDFFETAERVVVSSETRVIRGSLSDTSDVDVFDLGPVLAGDRIVVNMIPSAFLAGAIALFDSNGTQLLVNDHRNVYLGRTVPFVDLVIPRDSPACFAAVAVTPGFISSGDYALEVRRTTDSIPPTRDDVVLLVFDGGFNVRIGGRAPINVPVFDATDLSSRFFGQTEAMMDEIVRLVREDYEGLNIDVRSTHEGAKFARGASQVYFGTYDAALLGVAAGVDEFNGTTEQAAIVFTDTFVAFERLSPTVERMAQALANVASHEIGHLLGMVHTEDPEGIMDVTASLNGLMRNQVLARSPIYSAVFPIGFQDSALYLLDVLGGDPAIARRNSSKTSELLLRLKTDLEGGPARAIDPLSSCGLFDERPLLLPGEDVASSY